MSKSKTPTKDEDIVLQVKDKLKKSKEALEKQYQLSLDDVRFARLGEQWPQNLEKERDAENRPCLTINLLPAFIRQVTNDLRQNSPKINVIPVDDNSDPETAEVVNGIIRNIENGSNSEIAYDNAVEDAITGGIGYFRIDLDYTRNDSFDLDITIEKIVNPLSVFFDHNSTAADSSDWNYCIIEDDIDADEFEDTYPNAEKIDTDFESDGDWISKDSIKVVEYWVRELKDTTLIKFAGGQVIYQEQYEENQDVFDTLEIIDTRETQRYKVTQYLIAGNQVVSKTEWPGMYIPIVPVFGEEFSIEGERYFNSLVRGVKDIQRNFNYWRSASTELLALAPKAPYIGPVDAFTTDREKWNTANSINHPFIGFDGQIPPQRQPFSGPAAGALQEAANASGDLRQVLGMSEAGMGMGQNDVSGITMNARRKESDTSTYHFADNLSRAIRHGGRIILDLIPHVYNQARIMRVMGIDGKPDTVQVNQEFEQNGYAKIHDLTVGKYDLVVKTGASYSTKREEAASQMMELLRAFPQAAGLIGDLVATNLDWPGADEIAKRLKSLLPPEVLKLDDLKNVPPEAQAMIASLSTKMEEQNKLIEQGKMMLQQQKTQIDSLILESQVKDKELIQKDHDSQRKYDMAMKKLQAELMQNENNNTTKKEVEILKAQLEIMTEQMTGNFEQMKMSGIRQVTTPSGQTYRLNFNDGNLELGFPEEDYPLDNTGEL